MSAPHITDHAVLRYLERGWGVDINGLRGRIAAQLPAAEMVMETLGDGAVVRDGLRFHLRRAEDGTVVLVTVTSMQPGDICNRAQRLRRRVCK